jgi:sulfur-carrier protein
MATILLPRSLIALFPNAPRRCDVEAASVAQALDRLDELVPGIRNRLVDAGPTVRTHINIFVDAQLSDLDTAIRPDSTIHIIPAVSGG